MKVKKGTTRTVFFLGHVVIKVAVIKVFGAFKEFYYSRIIFFESVKKNGLKQHYLRRRWAAKSRKESIVKRSKQIGLEIIPRKPYEFAGVRSMLFGGVMANWNEYCFYRKTKNLFTMPTYFSFFGLFNVQKRGEEIDFWDNCEIKDYICLNSVNENQIFCDSHSFLKKGNFCLDGNKLKMLDYGNRHVHNFLILNGEKLFNNFSKPST